VCGAGSTLRHQPTTGRGASAGEAPSPRGSGDGSHSLTDGSRSRIVAASGARPVVPRPDSEALSSGRCPGPGYWQLWSGGAGFPRGVRPGLGRDAGRVAAAAAPKLPATPGPAGSDDESAVSRFLICVFLPFRAARQLDDCCQLS